MPAATRPPSLPELFAGFLGIGLSGFGGVLPFARRSLVERRRWLSEREFTELLGLAQTLPGPNIVNLSLALGDRWHGVPGALAAALGLLLAPLAIVIGLGMVYVHYGQLPLVHDGFAGIAAAAAGLLLATGLKMARAQPRSPVAVALGLLAFAGAGPIGWPLYAVLLALAPAGVAWAWRRAAGARP